MMCLRDTCERHVLAWLYPGPYCGPDCRRADELEQARAAARTKAAATADFMHDVLGHQLPPWQRQVLTDIHLPAAKRAASIVTVDEPERVNALAAQPPTRRGWLHRITRRR